MYVQHSEIQYGLVKVYSMTNKLATGFNLSIFVFFLFSLSVYELDLFVHFTDLFVPFLFDPAAGSSIFPEIVA